MFEDLNTKIQEFYRMNDADSNSFLDEINSRINSEPETFKTFMKGYPYGIETDRAIFYEALTKTAPQKWQAFLLSEVRELIRLAEADNQGAIEELNSLPWLTEIPKMDKTFYQETRSFLLTKLTSHQPAVREHALSSIMEIYLILDESPDASVAKQLQNCLKDKIFKNKVYAYVELNEANLIPSDFKFSFTERIKMKLQGFSI